MLRQIIVWIDRQEVSIPAWLAGFTGVVFVRFFLEAFSNPTSSGIIASDAGTLVHYWLFFLTALLGIACILDVYEDNPLRVGKFLLFGSPVIWLAPLIDMAIGGNSFKMGYFFAGPVGLVSGFMEFFLPVYLPGLTPGMRIEIAVILVLLGMFIWASRKSILLAALAALSVFIFIYLLMIPPSLIYAFGASITNVLSITGKDIAVFLQKALAASSIEGNDLHGTLLFGTPQRGFDYGFNMLMSQIFVLAASVFGAIWFHRAFPRKFRAVMDNCRPERIGMHFSLIIIGALLAIDRGLKPIPLSWVDGLGAVVLLWSWFCAGMYAIHVNDIADKKIDAISNTDRPLVRGKLSVEEMHESGFVWLLLSMLGSFSVGYYPFFMNLVCTACYYVYSAPPLRLKRFAMLSSFLISLAILGAILAGFFFLSVDKKLDAFPRIYALGVVVIFTMAVNIRDIKDVAGDKAGGIKTLPILFGANGVRIVGVLFALSFLLVPLFLQRAVLYWVAAPAAVAGYDIAVRKPYDERWVFRLYFCAIAAGVVLYKFFPAGFSGTF